jgi:hypothetical protein
MMILLLLFLQKQSFCKNNKVNENMNFKIERYPASAETLATDRTNVAIAISEGQWGRIDQHVVKDSYAPRSPMLFPEVRMVFVNTEGEFHHPLIGDMIEKKHR